MTAGPTLEDLRPAFIFEDVKGVELTNVKAQKAEGVPTFVLKNVEKFLVRQSSIPDAQIDSVKQHEF